MELTVGSSERRHRHLANGIVIAKACANWTETLPSSKSRDTKTRTDIKNLLRTKVRYRSVVSESVVICQLTLKMAEETDFENQRISNFKGLVTLTLDRVIWHTVVHHSSTSTYISNFIGIGKTFCGWTDVHLSPIYRLLGGLFGVDLKMHLLTLWPWLLTFQPQNHVTSTISYLYTKFEDIRVICFWVMLQTEKQTNRWTRKSYSRRPTELVWILIMQWQIRQRQEQTSCSSLAAFLSRQLTPMPSSASLKPARWTEQYINTPIMPCINSQKKLQNLRYSWTCVHKNVAIQNTQTQGWKMSSQYNFQQNFYDSQWCRTIFSNGWFWYLFKASKNEKQEISVCPLFRKFCNLGDITKITGSRIFKSSCYFIVLLSNSTANKNTKITGINIM